MIVIYREKNRKRVKEEKGGVGRRKIREIIAYLKQKYIPLNVAKATFFPSTVAKQKNISWNESSENEKTH